MNLLIANPPKGKQSLTDVYSFFSLLKKICGELGIEYNSINPKTGTLTRNPEGIAFSWHSTSKEPIKGVYHLKKGYVKGFMYFDKLGYSGWSELAQEYNPEPVLTGKMRQAVNDLCEYYIYNNISKLPQPTNIVKERDYVLVLGQMPRDRVAKLAYIKTEKLFDAVKKGLQGTGLKVYFKSHPHLKERGTINGPIHDVIRHAKAVYTVNSGAGFEALLHKKRVFVAGNCDYKWVASTVKSVQDIKNTTKLIDAPVDVEAIDKFLYYCFTEYFVNTYNKEDITIRLLKAFEEIKAT